MSSLSTTRILLCDESPYVRRLVSDVLRAAGFDRVTTVGTGSELLQLTKEFEPRIVITSSRIADVSGLDFTRMIRAGYGSVRRTLSIIVMTDTPTVKFLDAAREAGVDEMLVRPFTSAAILARVEAVLLRPRRLVETAAYVGPCRRRRRVEDYGGPLRRFTDPLEDAEKPLWEAETNRELVRLCITKISESARGLAPGDRRKLREIHLAVTDTEHFADEVRDQAMGDAARSLARYISAVGAKGDPDTEVFTTHIDAMQKLCVLTSAHQDARDELVRGLQAVVDKRLGLKRSAAA